MTRPQEFWAGVRATLPLVVGAIPFGIIYGALAVTNGLSVVGAQAMSALVYAGSAQFIAVGLIGQQSSALVIIVTTLVVNLRHLLYGASLGPYLRTLPQSWLVPLAFWLTDETYVVTIKRYQQPDPSLHKHWFFLGSALCLFVSWQVWTLVGMHAGQTLPNPGGWGFEFALIVTFIGMVVPMVQSAPLLACVVTAGITALLCHGLPNGLGLILAAVAGVAAGVATTVWLPNARMEVPQEQT